MCIRMNKPSRKQFTVLRARVVIFSRDEQGNVGQASFHNFVVGRIRSNMINAMKVVLHLRVFRPPPGAKMKRAQLSTWINPLEASVQIKIDEEGNRRWITPYNLNWGSSKDLEELSNSIYQRTKERKFRKASNNNNSVF